MSEEMDFIGKRIGNYQLTSRISSGGFGQVYLARHTLLKSVWLL
jgi:serine/threonine protein kinase